MQRGFLSTLYTNSNKKRTLPAVPPWSVRSIFFVGETFWILFYISGCSLYSRMASTVMPY